LPTANPAILKSHHLVDRTCPSDRPDNVSTSQREQAKECAIRLGTPLGYNRNESATAFRTSPMNTAEQIYQQVQRLPAPLTQEVLDFIGYLQARHQQQEADAEPLKNAQAQTMQAIWDNAEDDVWNEW
jgi:hypothetical protein